MSTSYLFKFLIYFVIYIFSKNAITYSLFLTQTVSLKEIDNNVHYFKTLYYYYVNYDNTIKKTYSSYSYVKSLTYNNII